MEQGAGRNAAGARVVCGGIGILPMLTGVMGRMPMPRFGARPRVMLDAATMTILCGGSLPRPVPFGQIASPGNYGQNPSYPLPLSSSSIGGLSFDDGRFRRLYQLASLYFSPFASRVTQVMSDPPACGSGRGHGRPARHEANPSAGCRCHTPMIWVTGVPPAWSFGKRARRPFPLGFAAPVTSQHTPANARVQGLGAISVFASVSPSLG